MRFIFLIFIFTISLVAEISASDLLLKEQFLLATPGDYIVSLHNRTFTLMHIHSGNEESLFIEEITIPTHLLKKNRGFSWRGWVREGAPRHTSWIMYELSKKSGRVMELYSFSRNGWLSVNELNSLLSTLLNLSFKKIPLEMRRKLGPPPESGEKDSRKPWNPQLYFNGILLQAVAFDAFEAIWPEDRSEIAGKTIEIYLPKESKKYPSYFPYCLQIKNSLESTKIRVIDAGSHIRSPKHSLPKRPPVFLDSGTLEQSGLTLLLMSPHYFKSFQLWALPVNEMTGASIPLLHTLKREKENKLKLIVSQDTLKKQLNSGQRYYFFVIPKSDDSIWAKTEKPILWR